MPPASGSGSGSSNGKTIAVIAAVVAVLLAIGGGVWLLTAGGGTKDQAAKGGSGGTASGGPSLPHSSYGKLVWSKPSLTVPAADIVAPTPGVWTAGATVVKQTLTGVTAYDLATGAVRWTVKAPSGQTCQATDDAVGGKVAVQYGTRCENVMVLDISAGRMLWSKALPSKADATHGKYEFAYAQLAISGDVLAMTWHGDSVAYRISNQQQLWRLKDGAQCTDDGFAGGAQLIDIVRCGFDGPYKVANLDPVTGNPKWTWDAPAGTSVTNIISTSPVVVGIGAGSDLITDAVSLSPTGTMAARVSLGSNSGGVGTYAIHCDVDDKRDCTNVVVSGDTLYLATTAHQGGGTGYSQTNEIAAFDLKTGNSRWVSKDSDSPMDLVCADGGSLIAYEPASFERGGKIIKVDPANGALWTYTTFSDATHQAENDAYGTGLSSGSINEVWADNTLVLAQAKIYHSVAAKSSIAALR